MNSRRFALLALLFMSGATTADGQEMRKQFIRLAGLSGVDYVDQREEFLQQHGVEEVLKQIADDHSADPRSQWLAEILIERRRDPTEFLRLTAVWQQKAKIGVYGSMHVTTIFWSPMLLADSPVPRRARLDDRLDRTIFTKYYAKKTLPESRLWPLLFGEVLLQRLGPDALLESQAERTLIEPSRPKSMGAGPGTLESVTDPIIRLDLDHSLADAISALTLLSEKRACREIETILRTKESSESLKELCIESLGVLGDQESSKLLLSIFNLPASSRRVRYHVPIGLSGINTPNILQKLRELRALETEPDVKKSIVNAIDFLEHPQGRDFRQSSRPPDTVWIYRPR